MFNEGFARKTILPLNFRQCSGRGLDVVRMWFGCGPDVAWMWLGYGSEVFDSFGVHAVLTGTSSKKNTVQLKSFSNSCKGLLDCEFQFEPQSPNYKRNKKSAQEVGFPPIPERAPEECKTAFCAKKSTQKVRFCTLLGALAGIGGDPTFCEDFFFAIWALWLELKFTTHGIISL